MSLHSSLCFLFSFLLPLSIATTIAKPNCLTKCGNLSVPYPFGIGSQCSLDPSFTIICNTSFDPPKPFVPTVGLEVVQIADDNVRIKNMVGASCYDRLGNIVSRRGALINLSSTPFSFSDVNKLTIVGCDDLVLLRGSQGRNFTIGSFSLCSNDDSFIEGECSGIGCAQTAIPKGFKKFNTSLASLSGHVNVTSFDACGYAFVGDPEMFRFSGSDLNGTGFVERTRENVHVVLDWAIGGLNCSEVGESVCVGNSYCVDSDTGLSGYRCSCLKGYRGNPYLSPGCTDINECESNPCDENGVCRNTAGSFSCSCKKGYYGDGMKEGKGCIVNNSPFPVAKFSLGSASTEYFPLNARQMWSRLYSSTMSEFVEGQIPINWTIETIQHCLQCSVGAPAKCQTWFRSDTLVRSGSPPINSGSPELELHRRHNWIWILPS